MLDASVAVKVFVEDRYSDQASEALRHYAPISPSIIFSEVANAFWLYISQGRADISDMRLSIRKLTALIEVSPDQDLVEDALALADELDHPVYDCLYMVLARREGLPLITADKRMLKLAHERLDIEVLDLATIPLANDTE